MAPESKTSAQRTLRRPTDPSENGSRSATIARFGAEAKSKLANPGATGEPEDQLRAPLEHLIADLAELCGLPRSAVAAVGESSLADTTELLNVLHVLGRLVALEPAQAELLDRIGSGPTISEEELRQAGALASQNRPARKGRGGERPDQPMLID